MIMGVRSIPVLAEASTFVAGMSLMPFGMFLIISVLSNLGISLVYATIGAYAVQFPAFWFAFVGAWLVPTLVMVLRLKRRHIR
jgi:membrane protein DedA with SNARE-associated domain